MDLEEINRVQAEADRLVSDEQVRVALDTMSARMNETLADRDVLVLPVMTGGIVPAGLLIPRLRFPMELDYLHATRYRGDTSGADLHWRAEPQTPIKGRTVLLIDDIFDEGQTLAGIHHWCQEHGAEAVYSAVLFEKVHDRKPTAMTPDFIGMSLEDRYLFGYGMDYKHYLRNAAGVFAVKGL